ncbi:MAG: type II toxin-antitoxin system PemK/MazF family toxin [Nitrococcus sp.]|nr:type II toxin-antitoxin system PemK/MazF family toxin [Nitrococcus sp.]
MANRIRHGQIWMYAFSRPDKRRPIVVLTRHEVIDLLQTVMVAPVTSTIRGAPSEVIVGIDEGLKRDSAINLDHIQTVDKTRLTRFIGKVGAEKMSAVCRALAIATGCAN